ncbi:hypothetical protein BDY21DRAFT_344506 [Lineolata rhizophorae]|uniref:Uncharacterized protein n=1 Tax=Lineolata rhizophorae TaxID=578093 RepID=A0A6A6P2I7_9PEZI|nr:hypothetical protein BDY21DRAFT_344506 [Lineolata rhizophorae]
MWLWVLCDFVTLFLWFFLSFCLFVFMAVCFVARRFREGYVLFLFFFFCLFFIYLFF